MSSGVPINLRIVSMWETYSDKRRGVERERGKERGREEKRERGREERERDGERERQREEKRRGEVTR